MGHVGRRSEIGSPSLRRGDLVRPLDHPPRRTVERRPAARQRYDLGPSGRYSTLIEILAFTGSLIEAPHSLEAEALQRPHHTVHLGLADLRQFDQGQTV